MLTPAERQRQLLAEIQGKKWFWLVEWTMEKVGVHVPEALQFIALRKLQQDDVEPTKYVLKFWANEPEWLRELPKLPIDPIWEIPILPIAPVRTTALELNDYLARILPPPIGEGISAPFKIRIRPRNKGRPRKPNGNHGVIADLENGHADILRQMLLGRLWIPEALNYVAEMMDEAGETPYRMELIRDKTVPGPKYTMLEQRDLEIAEHYRTLRSQGISRENTIAEVLRRHPMLSDRSVDGAVVKHNSGFKIGTLRARGIATDIDERSPVGERRKKSAANKPLKRRKNK